MTELCEGGSLLDVMRAQHAPLSEAEVAAATGSALEGLRYLHARKMLHRDVKAGNLLLTAQGGVKLGDLGISVQLKSTMARRMTVMQLVYKVPSTLFDDSAPSVCLRQAGLSKG